MRSRSISARHVLRAGLVVGVATALAGAGLTPTASAVSPEPHTAPPPAAEPMSSDAGRGKGAVGEPITPEEAFSRGEDWLNPPVPYSMSNHTTDRYGKSYRTDCSGFVSMAWHLPRSETTVSLPESTVERIGWDELGPGDAVNRSLPGGNGHVMLVTKVEGSTVHVMEQTPPQVTRSTHDKATLSATEYEPVRYEKMEAVSEEDIRERVEERMEELEQRINEELQREVGGPDEGAGDSGTGDSGDVSGVGARGPAATPSGTAESGTAAGGLAGRPAIAGDAPPAVRTASDDTSDDNGDLPGDDPLPDLDPRIQPPDYETLVNRETIFSIRDEGYREVIEMPGTGVEVEVSAAQTGWVWHWGDDSEPERTQHSGNPYPETPRVTHTYEAAGTYQPRVDIEWGEYRYRIVGQDEDWTAIEGETTTSVTFPELEAFDLRPLLNDPF